MGDSLERDWTCLGVNVIDNAIQEDRKMLAMVYHCTGKDKITKNDILEYIRQNNLFPEMKRKYCEARSIDLFN